MYGNQIRRRAEALVQSGATLSDVSRAMGVNRSTLRAWRSTGWTGGEPAVCFRCQELPAPPPDLPAYAHLLGLYLGDGCISHAPRGVYHLRIACCDDYPRLIDECDDAIRRVRPGAVHRVQAQGCQQVGAHWKHWPCVFPQHGPGPKHLRPIVLEPWQQEIVAEHPGWFLRGLFHSDGCRVMNWATHPDRPGKRYEGYPRYLFSNTSADIRALCCQALDALGVSHTHPAEKHVSVARRASVAVLDEHIGPKS